MWVTKTLSRQIPWKCLDVNLHSETIQENLATKQFCCVEFWSFAPTPLLKGVTKKAFGGKIMASPQNNFIAFPKSVFAILFIEHFIHAPKSNEMFGDQLLKFCCPFEQLNNVSCWKFWSQKMFFLLVTLCFSFVLL